MRKGDAGLRPGRPGSGQTFWMFVLRIAGVVLSTGVTVLLARALQPEKFGAYAFVLSIVTIASIPATIGLRQTVTREIAYAMANGDPAYRAWVWGWAMRMAAWSTVLIASGIGFWAVLAMNDPAFQRHLLIAVAILVLLPVPQIFSGALQGLGQIVQSQLPEFILRPGLLLALLLVFGAGLAPGGLSVSMVLIFLAAAVAGEGLASAWLLGKQPGAGLGATTAAHGPFASRSLTVSAISFGAIASVQLINSNLDILMLGVLQGGAGVGIYRAANAITMLVSFGLVVVTTVITPQIAGLHARQNRQALQALVTQSARRIALWALFGALTLAFGGRFILELLFGTSYAGGYGALAILALGQFANALFGPVALILNMTGNERLTLIGVTLSVVVNAALNIVLIPRLGILGAAIATAASLFLWNLLLAVALKQRTGFDSTMFGVRGSA